MSGKEREKKQQPELHKHCYYKYAKLMTTVKTRLLTHTKVALNVLTASEP